MEDEVLKQKIKAAVLRVTEDPVHKHTKEGSDKNCLYTESDYTELEDKVYQIIKAYKLDDPKIPEETKTVIVNDYLMNNVQIKHDYFDAFLTRIPQIPESELPSRTAHAALVKGATMCAGYAEACRVLLESLGINTKTLLSKLPGQDKRLLHYVTMATLSNGEVKLLDPEREASCLKKGFDFKKYQSSMEYMIPNEEFDSQKIGNDGIGIQVMDYISSAKQSPDGSKLISLDEINTENGTKQIATVVDKDQPLIDENGKPINLSGSTLSGKKLDLENLISNPNFESYFKKRNPVILVHGTQKLSLLNKVYTKLNKLNSEIAKNTSLTGSQPEA